MDEFGELANREREAKRIARRQRFWLHFVVFAMTQVSLVAIWVSGFATYPWFIFGLFGWGLSWRPTRSTRLWCGRRRRS
jgi:hypothetical protein